MANPTVQVNVRIDPALYAAVQTQARRENVNVTAAVTQALTDYVAKGEQGK